MREAALNSVFVYIPEALISLRLSNEYGGGWLVWVEEAIDSMYLRRCQPANTNTVQWELGLWEMQRVTVASTSPSTPLSHIINEIYRQQVLRVNLKLLMTQGHEICIHRYWGSSTRRPLVSFPSRFCQLIRGPAIYCCKVYFQLLSNYAHSHIVQKKKSFHIILKITLHYVTSTCHMMECTFFISQSPLITLFPIKKKIV